MKKPDENLIAAYIDGKLNGKRLDEMNKYVLNNPDLLKIINDTIKAKEIMSQDNKLVDLPWMVKDKVENQLNAIFDKKPLISLKLIKNGLREIFNSLCLPKETVTYSVRGEAVEAPLYHYTYEADELEFDIYIFFEDDDSIRIKLQVMDSDKHLVNGSVNLISKGKTLAIKSSENGCVEFSDIKRGEYIVKFDYRDILSIKNESKSQSIFLVLD